MGRVPHLPVEAVVTTEPRVLVEVEDLEVVPAEMVAMAVAMEAKEAMVALAALAVQAAQEVQQVVCPHRGQLRHQRRQLGGRTPDSSRSHPGRGFEVERVETEIRELHGCLR